MSDPTPGGYDPQNPPTRRYGQPPVPQHAPPPAIPPTDPQAGFPDQRPPVNPADPRLAVEAGRFWAGAAATALVAALIGLLGVIIFERIFSITLVPPPDLFGTGSRQAAWAIDGAILAVLAAGVLHLLILSTPRPRAFFGWIMALVVVVIAVLPFAWSSDVTAAALSGLINLLIGIAVWSLLAGVAGRTIVVRPATAL
ncbi:hypothetical protein ACFVSK_12410 [Cellulosimicrobium cellulans]|uniref:Uncharacterized protein n=1 Tax=Cellulosimicrobium funkei TaxID=264251 RepID=A0A0H2KNG6_9MICO|nr:MULTISPECIES: hypothetical protein [Cellulosimicrobium]KLN35045.1 hypothetical protein FB00_08955 [Cellulosimicrobium funkei]